MMFRKRNDFVSYSLMIVGRSCSSFDAYPLAHAHERLAEFVHAVARAVSPERISRLDIDEIGGVSVEKQSAQLAVLAELEI
jgi:hypothetical protein